MLGAMCGASWLLINGLIKQDNETISSGVTMLTIGMPISLIVIAMIFGQGGEKKLRELTQVVLDKDIPEAILVNVRGKNADDSKQLVELHRVFHGCVCEYKLELRAQNITKQLLEFKIELNVHKANVVVWLPESITKNQNWRTDWSHPYLSSLKGAQNEGYQLNEHPAAQMHNGKERFGVVLIKQLDADFLVKPSERLYFAQDFAFFIRSLVDAGIVHA